MIKQVKLKDRPKAEQEAIAEYIRTSHPSNLPKNIDTAKWVFFRGYKGKSISAGL